MSKDRSQLRINQPYNLNEAEDQLPQGDLMQARLEVEVLGKHLVHHLKKGLHENLEFRIKNLSKTLNQL